MIEINVCVSRIMFYAQQIEAEKIPEWRIPKNLFGKQITNTDLIKWSDR